MKYLAILVTAAAGIAFAAGCTAPAGPAASPTEGSTPNKTMWDFQKPAMTDKAFFTQARKGTTTLAPFSADNLTTMSQITCAAIGNGETDRNVLLKQALQTATGAEDGLTAELSVDLTRALSVGAQNYCPDLAKALA